MSRHTGSTGFAEAVVVQVCQQVSLGFLRIDP